MTLLRILAVTQGVYFALTGLWPILHIRSFEAVTGPKTDDWLVKTVGALITGVGTVLLVAGLRDAVSLEVAILAVGCALALAAIDVIYVARRVISPIYLLDAGPELALAALWGVGGWLAS